MLELDYIFLSFSKSIGDHFDNFNTILMDSLRLLSRVLLNGQCFPSLARTVEKDLGWRRRERNYVSIWLPFDLRCFISHIFPIHSIRWASMAPLVYAFPSTLGPTSQQYDFATPDHIHAFDHNLVKY